MGTFGVVQEGDTGLYYIRARYYDAVSARFISRDPAGSIEPRHINPYQYSFENPLLYIDSAGARPVEYVRIVAPDQQSMYYVPGDASASDAQGGDPLIRDADQAQERFFSTLFRVYFARILGDLLLPDPKPASDEPDNTGGLDESTNPDSIVDHLQPIVVDLSAGNPVVGGVSGSVVGEIRGFGEGGSAPPSVTEGSAHESMIKLFQPYWSQKMNPLMLGFTSDVTGSGQSAVHNDNGSQDDGSVPGQDTSTFQFEWLTPNDDFPYEPEDDLTQFRYKTTF